MKSLILNVPEEANEKEIKMVVASLLFEQAILSSGQAAEFVALANGNLLSR